jgi:hypothetical protein
MTHPDNMSEGERQYFELREQDRQDLREIAHDATQPELARQFAREYLASGREL